MRNSIVVLALTLLTAGASQSDEGLRVRYQNPTGRMSLTMSHEIRVRTPEPIASREFSFDLVLTSDPATEAVTVTIDRARASYTAHAMTQRLGTRHLTGREFPLSISDDGRQLELSDSSAPLVIDLGPPMVEGLSITDLVADTMPVLPEVAVAVGTIWTTERPVRSLEGWGWGTGRLTSRHKITAVERRGAGTVVSVATEAEASFDSVEDKRAFSGDLKRTLRWTFDATHGRLLSMSMEQETEGTCVVPQGEITIRQLTRVDLRPTASPEATR